MLMIYINVENYHGPDTYKRAQMFLGLQDKTSIYRWSSDIVAITVGAGEEFVTLPATRLDAEPILVDCTGPMTNFQCSGRGEAERGTRARPRWSPGRCVAKAAGRRNRDTNVR